MDVRQRVETVSTDCLSTWVDVIRETFVALDIAPADSAGFRGSVLTRHLAHLRVAEVASASQAFDRTARLVSRQPLDLFQIGMVVSGEAQLIQDGKTCVVGPGDFAIYETSRPFTWSLRPEWRLRVFTWPRRTVSLNDCESQRLTARTVMADSPVGRLLSPTLSRLLASDSQFSPTGAVRLADHVVELAITAALEESSIEVGESDSDELFARALQFIELHLEDPDLGPHFIAQAFFVSVRTLHRLFAKHGETVANRIRTRRLESCRRAMTSSPDRTLTDIATQFGFLDLAGFSRAFATAYGVSPSRYRNLRR
ncbi:MULTISPECIES: AraC-like ligand-binding domain-containing protein [unclassified Rhodococcus (in: high G+C Gram-positive bacteria)]|uniref:AraC-like ligand-binding domain-containing protein n=1 Tax=unclassified Rhodococcus (in: high G+C Gram-positive bacteria) TaxID=192944 RepID=UPI00092BE778|nr:helix-turn-helix domain-containing protein [Rhodococcus sp. M8]OLL20627.1 AraC family transcriptional regulator [Rhodococcus sp. M8]QPG48316.1 helix-turn-helix domain-containing protein [Rhodococcus sp. M8]